MRKKLDLAYISNDSVRRSTFNKRKKGFVKKLHELSVLCGIEACAVIYSPFNSRPEAWPSNSGVKNVVEKFEMLAEVEQEKKMVNHETFLQQSISKNMENNNRKMKDNTERTMKEAMFHLLEGKGNNNLMLNDRNREDLCKYIDEYLKELYHHRNVTLNQSLLEYGESSSAGNLLVPTNIAEVGSSTFSNIDAFNSSQLGQELWAFRPILSSNQRLGQVNSFGRNFLSTGADQQDYYPMMNPVNVCDQRPNLNDNHDQYQQRFGYSVVGQDGISNPNQNENQQEEWFLDQMMNHPVEMGFSIMDDSNRYHHQQP